ncbi:DUF3891 family protein [Candidatus Leptofilum sp.]|uniref:DUF3891 family protein n=1 Tax=Candidatus Leptofilum sp. TaxID=3241576 RepID=UPI003B58B754
MIIQTAPTGHPHLVIFQTDHAQTSGQIAAAFGNEAFASPSPYEPMVYVATHHDAGWQPIDARVEMDVKTGLPYHLTQTPLPYLLQTSAGSPEFNAAHHPYSGLMSSMHTYGLFNGRYGLSDKIFIDLVPAEHKASVQNMLDTELIRQAQLEEQLAADSATQACAAPEILLHNYKLLQFFDTLALYFQMSHEAARGESQFLNVPRAVGDDVTITIKLVEPSIYSLSPYPFQNDELTLSYEGRWLTPQPVGTDLKALLAEIAPITEEVILVRSA